MERKWKLGDDCYPEDAVLDPVTFKDIILAVQCNCKIKNKEAVIATAKEILSQRLEDFWGLINNNVDEIIEAATPNKPEPLANAPGWDSARLQKLATDIYNWLSQYDLWFDVTIYYDGKCMSTNGIVDGEWQSRNNGEPFIEEGIDPRKYFKYVANPHVLSMSFEGDVYQIFNGCNRFYEGLEEEFSALLKEHGLYYELGNAWNLTCYEG
jgi:hypothetical protein